MSDSPTLVALAEVAWGYFRTRKQFLLSRLAARGWRVLYLEPLAQGRGNAWGAREEGAVTIVTVPFLKPTTKQPLYNALTSLAPGRALLERVAAGAVRRALEEHGATRPDVLYVSNPYAIEALSAAPARLVCYDFNDHPLQFAGVPAWAEGYLDRSLARADVILAVSPYYARMLRSRVPRPVVLLGNGVEYAHFAQAGGPVPESLSRIAAPRVGYVGKVSHFLDFDVLEHLAGAGGFEVVVLGPLPAETERSVASLRKRPHAHVPGEVPYAELPAALQGLDVALIPFRAGDPFTVGINPNKLYQYWAAGLPIVSSPIEDVAADGTTLRFADTPQAFEREVRDALAHPVARDTVRARAMPFDWDERAARLDGLLRAALAAKDGRGAVNVTDVARFGEDGQAA